MCRSLSLNFCSNCEITNKMKYHTSPSASQTNLYSDNSLYRSTSPLPPPATINCLSATTKSYKYLRKLVKFDQMDFEFAIWQMIYLFVSPQKLYRNFSYRKQTKSQFARDDPAFLVLLVLCVFVTSIGLTWILDLTFRQTVHCIAYIIIVDFILVGILMTTVMWLFANRYLRQNPNEADVEWGYSFDVHMNAYFPPLVLLHFVLLVFFHSVINSESFFSRLFGNTIWLVAIIYYIYITFLGYNCIAFLKNSRIILAPIPVVFLFYVITLVIGWNITISFVYFYQFRVL